MVAGYNTVSSKNIVDTVAGIILTMGYNNTDINTVIHKLQQFTDLDTDIIQTAYNKVNP